MHAASHPEHGKETEDIQSEETKGGIAAFRGQRIPGDVVFKATADLPDWQRSAIRGFHAYAVEHDLSNRELAKLIKFGDAAIGTVFRGKYGAKVDGIAKAMKDFIDLEGKRKESRKLPFIVTKLATKMWDVCDLAREFQRMGFLFADSQIGKSAALEEYQVRNNHGSTIYTEMPAGGGKVDYMIHLAEILKIGTGNRLREMRHRIIESFDDRMLLIVDEAHRAIPGQPGVSKSALGTIEFIREIFNRKKCGVVFCATNVFRHAMEDGAVALVLKQTKRRRLCAMQLPNSPSRDDLNTFAAAYDLEPSSGIAREIETKMIDSEALGMWLLILRMAQKLAVAEEQNLSWGLVVDAHNSLMKMEKPS